MNSSLVPIDPSTLALIHSSFGKDGGLQPFAREIMLIECHVAGTSHVNIKEMIFNSSRQERHLLPPRTSAKNIPHASHSTGSLPLKVTAEEVDRSASHFSF